MCSVAMELLRGIRGVEMNKDQLVIYTGLGGGRLRIVRVVDPSPDETGMIRVEMMSEVPTKGNITMVRVKNLRVE